MSEARISWWKREFERAYHAGDRQRMRESEEYLEAYRLMEQLELKEREQDE